MACEQNEEHSNEVRTTTNWSVAEPGQASALGHQPDHTLKPPPTSRLPPHAARSPERVKKKAPLGLQGVTEP